MEHVDFMRLAIIMAEKCPKDMSKDAPKVGAVIARGGDILAMASRGMGDHAEKIAIDEAESAGHSLAGTTVYTTLEPCIASVRRKTLDSCADRLIAARVGKVVIGIHDPNVEVTGKGFLKLQEAGIETELFPQLLAQQIKVLNKEFIRLQKSLGLKIDKAGIEAAIKLLDRNVYVIKGNWIAPPDPPDSVRVIVRHNNIWWPQKSYPTAVGNSTVDWTSEITIGAKGLHRIIVGKVNPLGRAFFDYYWEVIKINKEKHESLVKLNDNLKLPENYTAWVGIKMDGDSPPKGIDEEDQVEIEIIEMAPKK